jgi:hypothetical protein
VRHGDPGGAGGAGGLPAPRLRLAVALVDPLVEAGLEELPGVAVVASARTVGCVLDWAALPVDGWVLDRRLPDDTPARHGWQTCLRSLPSPLRIAMLTGPWPLGRTGARVCAARPGCAVVPGRGPTAFRRLCRVLATWAQLPMNRGGCP